MSMKYEDHPLLVLVGAFNSQIMRNASWIKNYLFPKSSQKEITVDLKIPLLGGELSSSMCIDGIKIVAESSKIQFTPKVFNSSGYNDLTDVVVNLSQALPHTPLSAYGINCRFMDRSPKSILMKNPAFKKMFGMDCFDNYLKLEYSTEYENGKMTVSVIEKKEKNTFQISYLFNFHFSTGNEKSPMTTLKNHIIDGAIAKCLDHARDVANDISSNITTKVKKAK